MSNAPTTPVEAEGLRLLTDAELDAVSGGGGGFPTDTACEKLGALVKSEQFPGQASSAITLNVIPHVCPG